MKYQIRCPKCGAVVEGFAQWFDMGQACPVCACKQGEICYAASYKNLLAYLQSEDKKSPESYWHYFDFLPLNDAANIVSCGEGAIPIEEWAFLSDFAKARYGIDCKVYVYRNDLNGGTHTFKDIAASMAASVFKEIGIKEYCVASTGNTATAYSKYLSMAGVHFTVFVPNDVCPDSVDEMRSYGQTVVISQGNYAQAKQEAAAFSKEHKVPMSAGNIDPIRVESKRTLVFECMRQLGKMPDVYIQAVAGGTGPIALDKGYRELCRYDDTLTFPRMLLVQQDLCDPMVQAWEKAKASGFPQGYEKDYPIIENPATKISILSTGNPGMYPIIAPIVRKSGGDFIRVCEDSLVNYARMVRDEKHIHFGPASMVCMAGFYQALAEGKIQNGESVLLNCGEGCGRNKAFKDAVDADLQNRQ